MPANDVTVEGTFTPNRYKVTYIVDGEVYATDSVTYGERIPQKAYPTKEGYNFSGWGEVPETMPANDITLSGKFTVNKDLKYNLIYLVDGEEYLRTTLSFQDVITLEPAPTKEGHTFSGWSEVPETMPLHDVTVTGSFTANSYQLTYVIDGTPFRTVTIEYGTTITVPEVEEKEGYTFSGWKDVPEVMPANDVTVEGTFTANRYKVTYIVYGEAYATDSVTYGERIPQQAYPTKEGYNFSGWKDVPETMPAKDITLSGEFTVNKDLKYSLIYLVDGEEYLRTTLSFQDVITLEPAPTKEGHTFSGWSEVPETMPLHDVTVTGSFTANSYQLTYVIDGTPFRTVTIEYGTTITVPEVEEKEGYTFSGWKNVPEVMPANDVTIEGSYTLNSYTLLYSVDGVEYKKYELPYGSTIPTEAEPTKEGHTFSGWKDVPEVMPAKDVTIEGTFTANRYKVTYIVDGEAYATDSVTYGERIPQQAYPTKEGYNFSGWGEMPETMPANDITLSGEFTVNKDLKYSLIYLVDGEEYLRTTLSFQDVITLEPAPTKEGHTFSGWSEVPETMPLHDVTVTGSFTANSYQLTYVIDGTPFRTVTIEYGTTITVPEVEEKEGYTFSGWKDVPETMPDRDVTIEGSYTLNSYTLLYSVDGVEYKKYELPYGSTIPTEAEPMKEGYTFSGWKDVPETMPANDVTVEGTFTPNRYKVTYIVDGEVYATDSVTYGERIPQKAYPTKEGYNFSGWGEVPETMPAYDLEITGYFEVDGINAVISNKVVDVIYNLQGVLMKEEKENLPAGIYIQNGKKFIVK